MSQVADVDGVETLTDIQAEPAPTGTPGRGRARGGRRGSGRNSVRGFLVGLVGIDGADIDTWAEAIMPLTLLLSVVLNAAFAFATFPVAARIMYPDMPGSGLTTVGILGAALVGLVDWMIVSAHPNLPDWWSAGLKPPGWYQFLYGEKQIGSVDGTEGIRGGRDYATPKQPGFWARLLQFAPRLLLTAVLAAVIGTCASIGADETAVRREMVAKQVRLEDAARHTLAAQADADATAKYNQAMADYNARGKAWNAWIEQRSKLQEQADKAQKAADGLRAELEQIQHQIKCESGELKCPGVVGNPNSDGVRRYQQDYDLLRPRWVKANSQAESARNDLDNLKQPDPQGSSPTAPPLVDPRTITVAPQPVVGMAETLNAYFVAATDWPWYLRWAPHIVMIAIDLTPLLLKLSHGNASHERRRWDRLCADTSDKLRNAWTEQARVNQLLHEADDAATLAKARHETDMAIANVEKEGAIELHERVAVKWRKFRLKQTDETIDRVRTLDDQVAADMQALDQASWAAEYKRRWARFVDRVMPPPEEPSHASSTTGWAAAPGDMADTPPLPPDADDSDKSTEGHTPFSSEALLAPWVSDQSEQFDDTTVVVYGDNRYITGPSLIPVLPGPEKWARGEVLFAVKVPERRGERITPDRLHTICGVVKRSVNDVPEELVGNSLDLTVGNNATVQRDREGGKPGRLFLRYYSRNDLERHLNQLTHEGRSLRYADVASIGTGLCEQNLKLNREDWILLDGKPRNFLTAGMMEPVTAGESRLVGEAMGSVVLADFDNVDKPGPTKRLMTPQWAPPEFLDPSSAQRRDAPEQGGRYATTAVDVYAIAASMLYCATGQRLSDSMKPHARVTDFSSYQARPLGWWAPSYGQSFVEVMEEILNDVPAGLAKALYAGLEPNPTDRASMKELAGLFYTAETEAGDRTFTVDTFGPRPSGFGPNILAHVRRVGYNLVVE